jgi:sugar phosphate isomerase/epimerase
LQLSALSFSNDFSDPNRINEQVDLVVESIRFAAELGASVCRIFGGRLESPRDEEARSCAKERVLEALARVVPVAERSGVALALENHGHLPCSAEDQVEIIRSIDSRNLRATVDIGNYLQCGQEAHEGTAIAAPYASYVHLKDYRKRADGSLPWGWAVEACSLGQGDVDFRQCLEALRTANYDGYLAIEYEGAEDELSAVGKSFTYVEEQLRLLEL